jgi:hypothetical protein
MSERRSTQDARAERAADAALQHALRAARLHPDNERLARPALRTCRRAVAQATADGPLTLALHDARPGEDPALRLLREAGIGALVLAEHIAPADVDRLVWRLARLDPNADAESSLRQLATAGDLRAVRFTIAEHLPADDGDAGDWSFLPAPHRVPPAVQALVARDEAANLPAIAARAVLDDLTTAPALAACLAPLLRRLLEEHDLDTATWLLAESEREAAVAPATRVDLHELAAHIATADWLRPRVAAASRDELLQLAALALQLGDDVARDLAALVRDADDPSAPLVLDLLGS